ncbi:cysteine desulfurase [Emticicia aquatilis]|uniref:cysteine desulfurase n=1 Tax=Emticicia aquatilis TaxID=1537369 RepID=A0A916YZP4_9BACT|nr:family 2A encapsulin nanocompartment cargo protein cysteine desulfurase [Emticicia aquatilis]GGD68712.1 cysteine desulfurase [Emticicia aquatilis]
MNTNIYNQSGGVPSGLPDIDSLQDFANQLFKALPNGAPKEFSLNPTEHPRAKAFAGNLLDGFSQGNVPHDTHLAQSGIAPLASPTISSSPISGLGISPSVLSYGKELDINFGILENPLANHPNSTSEYSSFGGQVPSSVAGSGASPSYLNHGDNFNIDSPDTSFPDSNLKKGTNGGINNEFHLPLLFEHLNLNEILKSISGNHLGSHEPKPTYTHLYQDRVGDAKPTYYFLNERFPDTSTELKKSATGSTFDANLIKKDFPILAERVNGKPLIWLDNAATTQKPKQVIDRISYFYEHENSNIHRAAHELAARATDAYEAARQKVQHFLNAGSINEIIFVRGATEAINLVAQSWGEQNLVAGDEIIVSNLEHHANIVPWKRLADRKGLKLRVIPVDDDGQILLDEYSKLLNPRTKLVSFTQVSNALGTITPAKQIVEMAHAAGAKALVDGAQSVSHMRVDVRDLNADFFVFSGHKVFGPTGIGVLYGKEDILNATEPWQGGGNMIQDVTFEHIKYHNAPNRFEAGTGNIADAVGLGAAIDYVTRIGMDVIGQYEHYLLEYATHLLKQVPGLRLIGTAANKARVLSFTLQGYTNDQVGQALNQEGIAVRTGHHCAQPILRRMGLETTVRPSLAFYNTCSDVDTLVSVLHRLKSGHRN